jgi:alpha-1,2-mannosyltransferase
MDLSIRTELGIDFHTYEAAATVGLERGWSHIYDTGMVVAEQKQLVPDQRTQPFLSTPPVAWLAAGLAALPYWVAYYIWAAVTFGAYALALLWSGTSRGLARWMALAVAIAPWWVFQAIHVGQVAPLVAASVLLAWRLLRDDHDVAAGFALSLVLLKPNTALLVPLALLTAGRYRTLISWSIAAAMVTGAALLTLGTAGVAAYMAQLQHLPTGADVLTLHGALGVSGAAAIALRVIIIVAVLLTAYRVRARPGLVVAAGALGSLLIAPYLHDSDLCLLGAAGWIIWIERPVPAWRVALLATWVIASPYVFLSGLGPDLTRWPLVELALLAALVFEAWRPGSEHEAVLTGEAELRTRAPA